MSLKLACPNCQSPLPSPDSLPIGEAVTCTACGLCFLYPGANVRPSAPETMVIRRPRFFRQRRLEATAVSPARQLVASVALVGAGIVTFVGLAILAYLWYRTAQIVSEPPKFEQPAAPSQPAATPNPPAPDGPPPFRNRPNGNNSPGNGRPSPTSEPP